MAKIDVSNISFLSLFEKYKTRKQKFELKLDECFGFIIVDLQNLRPQLTACKQNDTEKPTQYTPNYYEDPALSIEIDEIAARNSLLDRDVKIISRAILQDLKASFRQSELRDTDFFVYGSFGNGLCCNDSDFDVYCITRKTCENLPLYVWNMFENSSTFERKELIEQARVPLVRLLHKKTQRDCDLTFSGTMQMRNTLLTKLYLTFHPSLKTLTLFLKHILKISGLHGTGKITTHVLFWLVVYFMQENDLLPCVLDLREASENEYYISGWDCALPDDFDVSVTALDDFPLSSLYYNFASFYSDFDFLRNVISPYLGCSIPIDEFENKELPTRALHESLRHLKGDGKHSFSRSFINLQDPSILTHNLTKPVHVDVMNYFKYLCSQISGKHAICNAIADVPGKNLMIEHLHFNYAVDPPRDLIQFCAGNVPIDNLPNEKAPEECITEAVRIMMETLLGFSVERIVVKNTSQIFHDVQNKNIENINVPVIYLDFFTTDDTYRNEHYVRIMTHRYLDKKTFYANFVCEVNPKTKSARILLQSNVHLVRFMQSYLDQVLKLIINRFINGNK